MPLKEFRNFFKKKMQIHFMIVYRIEFNGLNLVLIGEINYE